jgi:glycosyltransferase involved in cell wall biosynthesis
MSQPFVTVVMPVRNEGAFMARSLGAVLAQDYAADRMEVIIADGLSTDETRAIVEQLACEHPHIPVTLLANPGQIVSTGLNLALARARGEVIVRVDGHCEIAPDYVSRCLRHLQAEPVDAVGGPIETVGLTPLSRAIASAMSSPFGVGGSAFRTVKDKQRLVDTAAFPAYTRRALELAGAFDAELVRNQDDEYHYRLRKLGGRILLAPDVRSRYYSRSALRPLWRQYFQYGYWKVRVMQKHPRQMSLRQFVPVAFVMALLGSALLAPFSILGRALLTLVAGSYLLANLTASVWTARQSDWRYLRWLPLIFASLHISYGLGFLQGLVKFWNRWGDTHTRRAPQTGVQHDAQRR